MREQQRHINLVQSLKSTFTPCPVITTFLKRYGISLMQVMPYRTPTNDDDKKP